MIRWALMGGLVLVSFHSVAQECSVKTDGEEIVSFADGGTVVRGQFGDRVNPYNIDQIEEILTTETDPQKLNKQLTVVLNSKDLQQDLYRAKKGLLFIENEARNKNVKWVGVEQPENFDLKDMQTRYRKNRDRLNSLGVNQENTDRILLLYLGPTLYYWMKKAPLGVALVGIEEKKTYESSFDAMLLAQESAQGFIVTYKIRNGDSSLNTALEIIRKVDAVAVKAARENRPVNNQDVDKAVAEFKLVEEEISNLHLYARRRAAYVSTLPARADHVTKNIRSAMKDKGEGVYLYELVNRNLHRDRFQSACGGATPSATPTSAPASSGNK